MILILWGDSRGREQKKAQAGSEVSHSVRGIYSCSLFMIEGVLS